MCRWRCHRLPGLVLALPARTTVTGSIRCLRSCPTLLDSNETRRPGSPVRPAPYLVMTSCPASKASAAPSGCHCALTSTQVYSLPPRDRISWSKGKDATAGEASKLCPSTGSGGAGEGEGAAGHGVPPAAEAAAEVSGGGGAGGWGGDGQVVGTAGAKGQAESASGRVREAEERCTANVHGRLHAVWPYGVSCNAMGGPLQPLFPFPTRNEPCCVSPHLSTAGAAPPRRTASLCGPTTAAAAPAARAPAPARPRPPARRPPRRRPSPRVSASG